MERVTRLLRAPLTDLGAASPPQARIGARSLSVWETGSGPGRGARVRGIRRPGSAGCPTSAGSAVREAEAGCSCMALRLWWESCSPAQVDRRPPGRRNIEGT